MMNQTSDDLKYMALAIAEAAKCNPEDERTHPRVVVVVVKDGQYLATGFRGESGPGEHAEFTALEKKLRANTIAGATVYTTLEPCTTRNHPKVPCAKRLVERKVAKVLIGMLDPNKKISGEGVAILRKANIAVEFFPPYLMSQVEEQNRDFIRTHNTDGKSDHLKELNSPISGKKRRIFFSSPMAAHPTNNDYKKNRNDVMSLVKILEENHGVDVFYAGRNIFSNKDFDAESTAAEITRRELKRADIFVMVYPKKMVSSVLVEAGMALALNKKSLYFIKRRDDLPFLLKEIGGAHNLHRIVIYTDASDLKNRMRAELGYELIRDIT